MGIRSFTSYITNNSAKYLEEFELHKTHLVIEASTVSSQIYFGNDFQWLFGGEYDMYSKCVDNFFDELLKCNITPIVLFRRRSVNKKLEKRVMKAHEKSKKRLTFCLNKSVENSSSQSDWTRVKTPPFLEEVFKETLIKKKIQYICAVFEANNIVATVAKMLNCPVLSFDSNFFFSGISYIPFSTLQNGIYEASRGNGWVKHCKLYRIEKFVKNFDGLNESILPMATVLLKRGDMDDHLYKFYLDTIKTCGSSNLPSPKLHVRIEQTLRWLCGQTMDTVITNILSKASEEKKSEIMNAIEAKMEDYVHRPTNILLKLGFEEKMVRYANESLNKVSYTFNRGDNSNNSQILPAQSSLKQTHMKLNEDVVAAMREDQLESNKAIIRDLPQWFLDDLSMACFPSYFLDILVRRFYISSCLIPDTEFGPSNLISLNIIRMIYSLLVWGYKRDHGYLNYIGKGEHSGLRRLKLELIDLEEELNFTIPNLHGLRQLSVTMRLRIMNYTLLVNDERIIQELPVEWQLYIAVITYWAQKQEESVDSQYYIHCLLFSLLFNIIDEAIGYCRSIMELYEGELQQQVHVVQQSRQINPSRSDDYSIDISVKEAYNRVDREDCLLIAHFFIRHFQVDRSLFSINKKINNKVLHTLSQVRCCLKYSLHLNHLLGNPYQKPQISKIFNGVLLYNLYINFNKRPDIERHINNVLGDTPSLLRLYNVFLNRVKPLFSAVF